MIQISPFQSSYQETTEPSTGDKGSYLGAKYKNIHSSLLVKLPRKTGAFKERYKGCNNYVRGYQKQYGQVFL